MRGSGFARLGLLLALLLPPSPARAGGIEPALVRIAGGALKGAGIERDAIHHVDRELAELGAARVCILRSPPRNWSVLREEACRRIPGLAWEGEAGDWAQARVPLAELKALSELEGVAYLFRPPRGQPTAEFESEGLAAIGTAALHGRGHHGERVRIGILDLGFDGYERLLGGELPASVTARSFYRSPEGRGDITGEGVDHGVACAEIVHDIAPGADLYLANALTPVDLKYAVDWLIDEQVSVISHSVGWYFGSLNGSGPVNDIARSAAERGALWVNAAGNEALRHTWGRLEDRNGNGRIELDQAGDEEIEFRSLPAGTTLDLILIWDHWPLAGALDLALEIRDGSDGLVASSEQEYRGYPFAVRRVQVPATGVPLRAVVRRISGTADGSLYHLFRIGSGTRIEEHARPDRSLLAPADDPTVLAVGAVYWRDETLDSYSSRGSYDPQEGPVKPELCAPVGVSTATYGREGFRGTSAAAPHVAGVAGLLASASLEGGIYDLLWTREEVRGLLERAARPEPSIEPIAWGILRVPDPDRTGAWLAPPSIRLRGNPVSGAVRWEAPCEEILIWDAAGRLVGRSTKGIWNGPPRHAPGSGIFFARCRDGGAPARIVWIGAD